MKTKLILAFTASFFSLIHLSSQTRPELEKELKTVMDEARKDNSIMFPGKLVTEQSATVILELLTHFYDDTTYLVRSKAYNLTKKAGLISNSSATRQEAVVILTKACKDKDPGISGMASRYLSEFLTSDFNPTARQNISSLLIMHPPHFNMIIKLAGFLELTDQESALFNILYSDSLLTNKDRWAIHLALARIGNQQEIDYCINKVKRYPVNDDVVYELLPDLIYIRQKAAIDYLVEILNDDKQNCSSADPSSDSKILCGYRVMEYLAPVIKDFPLKVGPSGDIQDMKYPEALQLARKWFLKHAKYQLVTDTF